MTGAPFFSFGFPSGWWTCLGLAAAAGIIAVIRRPAMPRLTLVLIGLGALVLAVSGGLPTWNRQSPQPVAVMVDLSPSTRTADYRDRTFLERRIRELLRDLPYRIQWFSDHTSDAPPDGRRLADIPCDRTVYIPPSAPAVLLFSDCQFELPEQSSPTYVVLDPSLDDVEDASIGNLEVRGNEVAITIKNPGTTRRLSVTGVMQTMPTSAPAGSVVLTMPLAHGATRVMAELAPGDAWPENDALSTIPPPPDEYERWWVGTGAAPPSGWHSIRPKQLPTDPAAYLFPGVIVLDNVAASDLSDLQQQRIAQYLRDLGGGLLILGGDHAFAAGGYPGTALDSICPLASNPPEPTTYWVLLADASGSMSSPADGSSRWSVVSDALVRLLPHLPPHDLVSVGSFAENVNWWVEAKPVEQAKALPLPPASAYPHGPTNLQPALESIAKSSDGKMPVQLLVLSDFDTRIDNPAAVATLLRSKKIHLHLLAIGEGTALSALRSVCAQTGGSVTTELRPAQWAAATRELAQAAAAKNIEDHTVSVRFQDEAAGIPSRRIPHWNRVWAKSTSTPLAQSDQPEHAPMAARWNVGEGQTLAVSFEAMPDLAERLSELVSRPPHDPRFHVTVQCGSQLQVRVDAQDRGKFLDDQQLTLDLSDPAAAGAPEPLRTIPQSAPGRYELSLPAPRSSRLATVRTMGQILTRIAVAGRYAPEFDAVGNDRAAMNELAKRTGGQVVPPTQTAPLNIRWQRRQIPIASPLAIAGALLVALGLIWWRVHS